MGRHLARPFLGSMVLMFWHGSILLIFGFSIGSLPSVGAPVDSRPAGASHQLPAAGRGGDDSGLALVILRDTGDSSEHYPVLAPHPEPGDIDRVLTSGFSGRLLRLYRWVQYFLHRKTDSRQEPAYLLLSTQRGGFPPAR